VELGPILFSVAPGMLHFISSRKNNLSRLQGRGFILWSFPHALHASHGRGVDAVGH